MFNYFRKKILLRGPVKKIFLNFIQHYRYSIKGFDITYIQMKTNHTLPNRFLVNLTNEANKILENDFINKDQNPFFKNDEISNLSNHYLLLKALSEALKAKNIVEIGTASGMSLTSFLNSKYTSKVFTWDLVSLNNPHAVNWFSNIKTKVSVDNCLVQNSEKYKQYVEDLNDPKTFEKRKSILEDADIIFIDGPHNGVFEKEIYKKILNLNLKKNSILILDDIKLSSMVSFWDDIDLPKLDITHIGHLTGTGIVKLK